MIKIKSAMQFNREVCPYVWETIQYGHVDKSLIKGLKYEDMRLLGAITKEKNAKEYKRDFSFIKVKREKIYMEHVPTKKIYSVVYYYKTTFKSDGFDIQSIALEDVESITEIKQEHREDAILKIDEHNSDYGFEMFILSLDEGEEYENVRYSYYLNWYDKDEFEDEEDEE